MSELPNYFMNFGQIIQQLQQNLALPLPADNAHTQMSPPFRYPPTRPMPSIDQARQSAVLLMLYEKNGITYTALMKRTEDSGRHSGQISLPGGGVEASDRTIQHTALRETEEEFGIAQAQIHLLGNLSALYIPVSNSLVQPVVGYLTQIPVFVPDPKEVSRILEIPVSHLADKSNRKCGYVQAGAGAYRFEVPYYDFEGEMIWGATAMIISEFLMLLHTT